MHLLDVVLPKALNLNSTINIVLETVQTHVTWAWPQTAAQGDGQALKYKTNLLVPSPYKTHVQRTKVKYVKHKIFESKRANPVALQVAVSQYHFIHHPQAPGCIHPGRRSCHQVRCNHHIRTLLRHPVFDR